MPAFSYPTCRSDRYGEVPGVRAVPHKPAQHTGSGTQQPVAIQPPTISSPAVASTQDPAYTSTPTRYRLKAPLEATKARPHPASPGEDISQPTLDLSLLLSKLPPPSDLKSWVSQATSPLQKGFQEVSSCATLWFSLTSVLTVAITSSDAT